MLQCKWCGLAGTDQEFEHSHNGTGFWCPNCDGFTFLKSEDQLKHRFLLLLEQKAATSVSKGIDASASFPHLRKHLSPLRYPGGKSKVIDHLYARLAEEKLDTFVEVFAGGASFGLSLLDAGIIQHLVLNDIDPGVYSLWEAILNRPQELVSRLLSKLPTHQDLAIAQEHLASCSTPSPLLAWSFLLANRLSYSGIISANPQGGKHGSQEALLSRWNPETLVSRILRIHAMRDRIELHCKDCCELIEEDVWWMPGTTLFIDPPYFEKGQKLYRHCFKEEDHVRLANTLNQLYTSFPEADILLTYDDQAFIRNLYPYSQQESILRTYSI